MSKVSFVSFAKYGISHFLMESQFLLLGNGILRLKFGHQVCSLSWIWPRNMKCQSHVFTLIFPNKIWNFHTPFLLLNSHFFSSVENLIS